MSDLRQQLRSAGDAHRLQRYPGDLAAEVLPPGRSVLNICLQTATVAAAMVAVIFLAVWLSRAPVSIETADLLVDDDATEQWAMALPVITIPEQPEEFTLMLTPPAFAIEIPSFPSWDAETETTSTTQEAM
jgi:hypothetical protein